MMSVLITTGLVAAPVLLDATGHTWDGKCADPIPPRWRCLCSEPNHGSCNWGSTSNWNTDGIPGTGDNATIGPTLVIVDNNTTVGSVDASGGLKIDSNRLTIEDAGSSITGLQLTGEGGLTVLDNAHLNGTSTVRGDVWGPGTLVKGRLILPVSCGTTSCSLTGIMPTSRAGVSTLAPPWKTREA